jgi:2-succinyl-6-hydroxy-2,4-cyclohexadiene-1-carboxylate synthase
MTARARRRWVLLHGFTGSPATWDEVRAALEPLGAVACPALAGHGPDAGPASSFDAEVERLARLVASAGFAGAHLCGYSLGARLALGLLVRHPALFARATLVGVNPGLPEGGDERAQRAEGDERWARLAERSREAFLAQWASQPLFASQRAASPQALGAQERARAAHDGAALAGAMRALSLARMPDWTPFLPRLAVPVHLVAGELDAKFVAIARSMATAIAHARLTVVPGAGHNVVLERPDAIVAALRD